MDLISCICVTADRPKHLRRCIEVFKSQTYESKELVILDDGEEPSLALSKMQALPENIKYTYNGVSKQTIPIKLNTACVLAKGSIIAHWDDDDWYSADRLTQQYELLKSNDVKLAGYHEFIFYCEIQKRFFTWSVSPRFITGSSLFYTKELWATAGFDETKKFGSDRVFVAQHMMSMKSVRGELNMIAHHHVQSSHKRSFKFGYKEVLAKDIPQEFFDSLKYII